MHQDHEKRKSVFPTYAAAISALVTTAAPGVQQAQQTGARVVWRLVQRDETQEPRIECIVLRHGQEGWIGRHVDELDGPFQFDCPEPMLAAAPARNARWRHAVRQWQRRERIDLGVRRSMPRNIQRLRAEEDFARSVDPESAEAVVCKELRKHAEFADMQRLLHEVVDLLDTSNLTH